MDLVRAGASAMVNSICFKPLEKKYDFDFQHKQRRLVFIPISIPFSPQSSSPTGNLTSSYQSETCSSFLSSSTTTNNSETNDGKDPKIQTMATYHCPCMLIRSGSNNNNNENNENENNNNNNNNNNNSNAKHLIVAFHGTSGDINRSSVWANLRNSLDGIDTLFVEFPSYGVAAHSLRYVSKNQTNNSNTVNLVPFLPSRESTMAVGRGIMQFVLETMNVEPSNIILAGRSIGTGIASELCTEFPNVGGLVLISPYACMQEVISGVARVRGSKYFMGGIASTLATALVNTLCVIGRTKMFAPEQYIGKISDVPLWIGHGKCDSLIPLYHAQRLVNIYNASHQNSSSSSSRHITFHVDETGEHAELNYERDLSNWLNMHYGSNNSKNQLNNDTKNDNESNNNNNNNKMIVWDENYFSKVSNELRKVFPIETKVISDLKKKAKTAFTVVGVVVAVVSIVISVVVVRKIRNSWF